MSAREPGAVADVTFRADDMTEPETMRGIRWSNGWIVAGESGYEVVHDRVVLAVKPLALLIDLVVDPRLCGGRNPNVCVAEGCYGEACVTGHAPRRGDDLDVKAGRCCPSCRADLTEHNKSVWNGGYGVGHRHGQDLPAAADALRELRRRFDGTRLFSLADASVIKHVIDTYVEELER